MIKARREVWDCADGFDECVDTFVSLGVYVLDFSPFFTLDFSIPSLSHLSPTTAADWCCPGVFDLTHEASFAVLPALFITTEVFSIQLTD